MDLINSEIEEYAFQHTKPATDIIQKIDEATHAELQYAQMLSGRVEGRLLQFLVQVSGAKNILEIGMFTGYSALSMAEVLPEDGKIITCETNDRYRAIAERFFEQSPHGKKIEIRMGQALDTLISLKMSFDLIFLDADKDNYPAYYELIFPLLKKGGVLVIDNTLWSGEVLNPEDRKSKSIDRLNKMVLEDDRVENVILTVRDGINLVRKIRD